MPAPDPSEPRGVPLLDRGDLKPDERRRVGRVVAVLLGWGLASSGVLGLLAIWHLVRRGRLIRANLARPRVVRWPDLSSRPEATDLHED